MTDIDLSALDRELKKGATELLLLSVLEARPRRGYEFGKLIEAQSGGRLVFHLDSLYPLLYRLEERRWITGTWVEKVGKRRRRFYRLTPKGQRVGIGSRSSCRATCGANPDAKTNSQQQGLDGTGADRRAHPPGFQPA